MQLANVDDPKVKTAVLANIVVETVVCVISVALFASQVCGVDLGEAVARNLKGLRNKIFGSPPPTEEDIQRLLPLVHIEAERVIREAMP